MPSTTKKPAIPRTKWKGLHVRLSPEDNELVREAAERAGRPIAWFVRSALLAAAEVELGREPTIR